MDASKWYLLPCKMAPILIETPIISKAHDHGNGIYTHQLINRDEYLEDFLMRICGSPPFYMDCSIYMQLINQCDDDGFLQGYKGKIILSIACTPEATDMLYRIKKPATGYIRISDDKVHMKLQNIPTPDKGEWVIRMNNTDDPLFLGLADDGPALRTFDVWVKHIQTSLISYGYGDLIKDLEWTIDW